MRHCVRNAAFAFNLSFQLNDLSMVLEFVAIFCNCNMIIVCGPLEKIAHCII